MPPFRQNACRTIDRSGSALKAFHTGSVMATVRPERPTFATFMAEVFGGAAQWATLRWETCQGMTRRSMNSIMRNSSVPMTDSSRMDTNTRGMSNAP
jgi:hypothetical protein